MTICYVVPGTLGSQLLRTPARGGLLWVDYLSLLYGQGGGMRLAPDGVTPGPPDGLPLSIGAPLPDYYGSCIGSLIDQLEPLGYSIVPWGWDWRTHFFGWGGQLAAQIVANVQADDPCSIVAHSAGGLVARAAWASLAAQGQSGLVRRIVTLGTPHYGTYYPVAVLSGGPSDLYQMVYISGVLGGLMQIPFGGSGRIAWTPSQVATLAATWPLIYDLFPVVGAPGSSDDSARVKTLSAGDWTGVITPDQTWLDYARTQVQPWLLSAQSMPPNWIMTCLAGEGTPTPDGLDSPAALGVFAAIGVDWNGDGVVTLESSMPPGCVGERFPWRHADLPTAAAANGWLAAAILAVRTPTTPPPAVTSSTDPDPVNYAGPPITAQLGGPRPPVCGEVPCLGC